MRRDTSHDQSEEQYPMTLTPREAEYLDRQLAYLGKTHESGPASKIRAKLGYAPPRYSVGTRVTRQKTPWDTAVWTVVAHRWVSPGNWTAMLASRPDEKAEFGVGEVYLDEVA